MNKKTIQILREFNHVSPCPSNKGMNRTVIRLWAQDDDTSRTANLAFKRAMMQRGYEGGYAYQQANVNNCAGCNACVPLRIVVTDFKFSRSERKLMKMNDESLTLHRGINAYMTEQYELYKEHFKVHLAEHSNVPILSSEEFRNAAAPRSHIQIFRSNQSTAMKSVMYFDDFGDSLYAAHQSYDPDMSRKSSLGRYALLKLIEHAQQRGDVKHIYIGYWIKDDPLLGYKKNFQPLETFNGTEWIAFDPDKHTSGPRLPAIEHLSIELP